MALYTRFVKRLLDILVSAILLLIFFPILVIISLLLSIVNRGTPFFIQERPGYLAKSIRVIKFKTMLDKRDFSGQLLPDNQRMTMLGRFLRQLSIDELPQLINVLKGDMSMIGPRPLLFKYLPLYNEYQRRRHLTKPGITGWAQVNGRNSISWNDRFKLDVYYVENLSLSLDLKIIWLTIVKVLTREGVNQSDERPMQPFDGTN